jgi:hypothetical protein
MIETSGSALREFTPESRDPEILLRHARLDRQAGKDIEAVERLRDAVSMRPDHPAIHVELAGALMSLGHLEEAGIPFEPIHAEWRRSVLRARPELDAAALERRRAAMDAALPDACVSGYAAFVEALTLPDPDDRHVLAVAVRAKAQVIVTFNERDFPAETLAGLDVTLHKNLPAVVVEMQRFQSAGELEQ